MTAPRSDHASNPDQLMARALGVCWHSPTSDRWPCQEELPMTPAPSSPVALLDQLDELRAKATPGEWSATSERADGGAYIDSTPQFAGPLWVGHATVAADAALIVAAVNALGGLVTVVREMWDEHDGRTCCDRTGPSFNGVELCGTRQMIETALSVTP